MNLMTANFNPPGLSAGLPSDLRTVSDESILLNLTLQSVADSPCPKLVSSGSDDKLPLSPAMMLTLINYAYSIGIFGSRDIENAIYKDAKLRYICAHQYPAWQDIRRFRRSHRELIQISLQSLLTALCVHYLFPANPQLATNVPPAEVDEQIRLAALGRIEAAIIMDAVEADI